MPKYWDLIKGSYYLINGALNTENQFTDTLVKQVLPHKSLSARSLTPSVSLTVLACSMQLRSRGSHF